EVIVPVTARMIELAGSKLPEVCVTCPVVVMVLFSVLVNGVKDCPFAPAGQLIAPAAENAEPFQVYWFKDVPRTSMMKTLAADGFAAEVIIAVVPPNCAQRPSTMTAPPPRV